MINFNLYDDTKERVAREFFEAGEKNLSGTCVGVGWSMGYIEEKGGIDMDLLHSLCDGKYDITTVIRGKWIREKLLVMKLNAEVLTLSRKKND